MSRKEKTPKAMPTLEVREMGREQKRRLRIGQRGKPGEGGPKGKKVYLTLLTSKIETEKFSLDSAMWRLWENKVREVSME